MKLYICIPYTGMEERSFKIANQVAADLIKDGFIVYSPISHSHPIATQCGLDLDFKFWEKIDKCFIDWCDIVLIVDIAGWQKSIGVNAELKYAKEKGKMIWYHSKLKF